MFSGAGNDPGLLRQVEPPFVGAPSVLVEPAKACVTHEEIDPFHPPPLFFFVQSTAPLSPVALFICPGGKALLGWRRGGVEIRLGDVLAQRPINSVNDVLERDEYVIGCLDVKLPREPADSDGKYWHRGVCRRLRPDATGDGLVVSRDG